MDEANASFTPRVFSGIQPSGGLTLGNYLGAIRRFVDMQNEGIETIYCMVDLHAMTVWQDPAALRRNTRELAAGYLAAGLDPQRSILFNQSQAPEHAQLAWIFNCVARMGWMQRMTQWKDKAGKNQQNASLGLFAYPALMAADILAYHATHVPVGEDQKQHVELTRDIAQRFNNLYGETFVLPEPAIAEVGARIMGFDDPTAKMSKSALARGHAVRMTDSDDEIRHTLRRAVTDSGRDIVFSDATEKAGVNNLLTIYQLLTDKSREEVLADFADARGYGDLKSRVADVVVAYVGPIRARFRELMADPAELDRILAIGAERARALAETKIVEVKEKMGFLVPDEVRP